MPKAGIAVMLLVASATSCGGSSTPHSTTRSSIRGARPDAHLVLPQGITYNTEATGPLPAAQTQSPELDLHLYADADGRASLGVSVGRTRPGTPPAPATPVEQLGPQGIHGCQGADATTTVILMSRAIPAATLCTMLALDDDGLVTAQRGRVIAALEHTPLPGIGSVPVPVDAAFDVRSYTSAAGGDVQRSVVVATFAATPQIIDVFDWWFGAHEKSPTVPGATRYELPAYVEVNQDPTASAAVPTASLTVRVHEGRVVLVRCTALDVTEEAKVLGSVEWN